MGGEENGCDQEAGQGDGETLEMYVGQVFW